LGYQRFRLTRRSREQSIEQSVVIAVPANS
jgi:hypothetical protein